MQTAKAGIEIPSMTSTIDVEVDPNGAVRVEGVPSIPEVLVGEGTRNSTVSKDTLNMFKPMLNRVCARRI